ARSPASASKARSPARRPMRRWCTPWPASTWRCWRGGTGGPDPRRPARAGASALGGVRAALLRRERFGVGGFVDVTLIESMMSLLGIQYQEAEAPAPVRSAAFRPARGAAGHIVVPLVNARNFLALFSVIGRPEWAPDALMAAPGALARRRREVEDLLGAWAAGRRGAECVRLLNAAGAPCGAYATPSEALAHPHLAERGSFAEIEDAGGAF